MAKKSLRVFTTVWGTKHLKWLEKYCVQSLAWPKNVAALEGATWTFLTREQDKEEIEFIVNKAGIKVANMDFMLFGPEIDAHPHSAGAFINQGLLWR